MKYERHHSFRYKGRTFTQPGNLPPHVSWRTIKKRVKRAYDRYSNKMESEGSVLRGYPNHLRLFEKGVVRWDVFCRAWRMRDDGFGMETGEMVALLMFLGVLTHRAKGNWEVKLFEFEPKGIFLGKPYGCRSLVISPCVWCKTPQGERAYPCFFTERLDALQFARILYDKRTYDGWPRWDRHIPVNRGRYKTKVTVCQCGDYYPVKVAV